MHSLVNKTDWRLVLVPAGFAHFLLVEFPLHFASYTGQRAPRERRAEARACRGHALVSLVRVGAWVPEERDRVGQAHGLHHGRRHPVLIRNVALQHETVRVIFAS